jgi:hypothetical protein
MGGAMEQIPVFKGTFAIPIPPFLMHIHAQVCTHEMDLSI